jgi:hypothetical protein
VTSATRLEEPQPVQIIVFGIELKRVIAPAKRLPTQNYVLHFEPFDTPKRFDEFDGVIAFQGTFENIAVTRNWTGDPFTKAQVAKNELDKRIKELDLLFDKGGFACFLLCEPFIDEDSAGTDLRATDLVKYYLNADGLYRHNFPNRLPSVRPVLSEFKPFLNRFGAANSWFETIGEWRVKRIATAGNHLVGMIFGQQVVCVPVQTPEAIPGKVPGPNPAAKEFFTLLADGLVAVVRKLTVEIPAWVDAYTFDGEREALERRAALEAEVTGLDAEVAAFRRFKRVLVTGDYALVEAVRHLLETGFGFKLDATDELREDLKILGDDGKPIILAEVTGTNAGVSREKVNQADNHRERAGLAPPFPSILIINTNIKNARSLDEKDKPVAPEQVKHAKRQHVLVLRTLDLLRLLGLYKRRMISRDEVLRMLRTGTGWLRVTDERAELVES